MLDAQSQVSTVAAAVVFSVDKLPELMCGKAYCHDVKPMTNEISEFFLVVCSFKNPEFEDALLVGCSEIMCLVIKFSNMTVAS